MTMTAKEAAALLDGREYRKEITRDEEAVLKSAGLVAAFGASDDLMEFRGAWRDEAGTYGGNTVYVNSAGMLYSECDDECCPYFERAKLNARKIEAVWDEDGFSWLYVTDIPHETFVIMDDGETYCRGIVFRAEDAA